MRPEEIGVRKKVLAGIYNKDDNLQQLLRSIWQMDEPLAVR
jgi:hypothetical protein